jgi:hypothetical protein
MAENYILTYKNNQPREIILVQFLKNSQIEKINAIR